MIFAIVLACCIDSPAWQNPREGAPPMSCSDIKAGKAGMTIVDMDSCDAHRVDDHWHFEGTMKHGGDYSFDMSEPNPSIQKDDLLQENDALLDPKEPKSE